ncbi:MAG: hypothetical protein JJ992_00320 [Planctomycetes bacterium]|nr:hypothetical protein [Planctomycetota bacterium]
MPAKPGQRRQRFYRSGLVVQLGVHADAECQAETRRGKKITPAITLPQIREGSVAVIFEANACGVMYRVVREREKRLECSELARFYFWKKLNRLPPLNIERQRL